VGRCWECRQEGSQCKWWEREEVRQVARSDDTVVRCWVRVRLVRCL
jgi:hypothetical protein